MASAPTSSRHVKDRRISRQPHSPPPEDEKSITIHPIQTLSHLLHSSTEINDIQIQNIMSILQTIASWYQNVGLKMDHGAYPALALDTTPLSPSSSWFTSIRLFHLTPTLPSSTLSASQLQSLLQQIRTLPILSSQASHTSTTIAHLLCIHMTLATSHLLLTLLYQHMSRITRHIHYWRTQDRLWQWPWNPKIEIQEKLKQLKAYRKKWMIRAGRLHFWIHTLSSSRLIITSSSPSPTYTSLCERLYRYICGEKATRMTSMNDVIARLEECVQGLNGLDEHLTDATLPYEIPSHLARYWGIYTLTTASTFITCYQLYTHRDELHTWLTQAMLSSQAFMDEHVITPLHNIIRHVFHTFYETSTNTTSTRYPVADALHQYQQSQQNLTDMLLSYGQHHTSSTSTSSSTSLVERAQSGDMSIVMDSYTKQVEHPIKAVLFDDLTTGILIQVQKLKVDGEAALLTLEQLLQQNAINFNLLATIPAGLLIYGCLRATSYIGRIILRERDTRAMYTYVRSQIHHIHMILLHLERIENHELIVPSPTSTINTRRSLKRPTAQRDAMDILHTSIISSHDDIDDDTYYHGTLHVHIYRLYRTIWQLYVDTRSRWIHEGDISLLHIMRSLQHMMSDDMTCEQQRIIMEQMITLHPQLLRVI